MTRYPFAGIGARIAAVLSWVATLSAICTGVVACGTPGIGMNTEFHRADFQINKTTKREVVNFLGLPQKIVKGPEGREHYLYEGSTRLVGLCVGCGNPSNAVGVIPSMINNERIANGAEYVFNSANVLIAKFGPKND